MISVNTLGIYIGISIGMVMIHPDLIGISKCIGMIWSDHIGIGMVVSVEPYCQRQEELRKFCFERRSG